MKRFRLRSWDLMHLLSDGAQQKRQNLERIIRKDGDYSPIFKREKKAIEKQVREFEKYQPQLSNEMTTETFLKITNHYAAIKSGMEKLCAASYLKFSEDTANNTAKENNRNMMLFNATIMHRLIFFELWIRNGLDDINFERITKEAPSYECFMADQRRFKIHGLDDSSEKSQNLDHLLDQVANLQNYEEATSNLKFNIHERVKVKKRGSKRKKEILWKKTVNEAQLMNYLRHPRRAVREEAAKALFKEYGEIKDTLWISFVIQGIKWKEEFIEKRGYQSAMKARNYINGFNDDVVANALDVSRENTSLFRDYFFNIKKNLACIRGKMDLNDLYAPVKGINGKRITYETCMNTVYESIYDFNPELAEYLIEMDRKGFIHSKPQKNKWIGTYSYPTPPGTLPYTLINFTGYEKEIIDIAHEIGHALANILSCAKNSVLNYTPSDPVAEISSYFFEFLAFDKLFQRAQDNEEQMKKYLIYFLDNAYEYTAKKSHIVAFEEEAHKMMHSPGFGFEIDKLSSLYLKKLKEQWGEEIHVPEYYKDEWLAVGNIMCSPFEDLAYPFGYAVANNLHEKYKKEGSQFAQSVINIMSAGDVQIEEFLKKEVGFDIKPKEFSQHSNDLIKEKFEELKKLM